MHARTELLRRGIGRLLLTAMFAASVAVHSMAAEAVPNEWHVSTRGDDSWSGLLAAPSADGTDGPFRTLDRARLAVRRVAQNGQVQKLRQVVIHAGTYRLANGLVLDDSASGSAGAPTIFRSAGDGEVVLTSGSALFARALSTVTDPATLGRLTPQARRAVMQLDGSALGFTRWPNRIRTLPPGAELFVDGQRMRISRWPNQGWATIAAFGDVGAEDTADVQSGHGATFKFEGDQPRTWSAEYGVWLQGFWRWDWNAETVKVASVDRDRQAITLAAPTNYGVQKGNPSPRRFRALNVLSELDEPGEYWVDPASLRVVLWPPASNVDSEFVVSSSATPVITIEGAHDIILSGLTLEATQSSCVVVRGGERVAIVGCEVRNAREFGIRIDGGNGHSVRACDVHSTGCGGIRVEGGDRRELTGCGHEVTNCHVWRFAELQMTFAHGVHAEGVGIRIANNLIEDAPHQGVYVQGNDNVFERNFVRNVCLETDDCGAYYCGRNPSCRGNSIRDNCFMDIGSIDRHGCASVYFDDGQGGDVLTGNVFVRGARGAFGAIFVNGGRDVQARGNVFIDCQLALGSAPWSEARWGQAIAGEGEQAWLRWPELITREVDIRSPTYLRNYPRLSGFFARETWQDHRISAECNVLAGCKRTFSGDWRFPLDRNVVEPTADAAFVEVAAGNLSLQRAPGGVERAPCYKPPSLPAIGLQLDSIRRSVDPKNRPTLGPMMRTGS